MDYKGSNLNPVFSIVLFLKMAKHEMKNRQDPTDAQTQWPVTVIVILQ